MTWSIFYLICLLIGLGLSGISFLAATNRLHFLHHGTHTHHGATVGTHGAGNGQIAAHSVGGHAGPGHGAGVSAEVPHVHVSPINMAAGTAFLALFGAAGVVSGELTHWSALATLPLAVVTGGIGGAVVNRFIGLLAGSERPMSPMSMIGVIGRVTSGIRAAGTGEIVFLIDGTRHVSAARSENALALEKGTEVIVMRYEKGIAWVSTWDEIHDNSAAALPAASELPPP